MNLNPRQFGPNTILGICPETFYDERKDLSWRGVTRWRLSSAPLPFAFMAFHSPAQSALFRNFADRLEAFGLPVLGVFNPSEKPEQTTAALGCCALIHAGEFMSSYQFFPFPMNRIIRFKPDGGQEFFNSLRRFAAETSLGEVADLAKMMSHE